MVNDLEKVPIFIKDNSIDTLELYDIMVAISTADKLFGIKGRLSIDYLVSSDDVNWNNIINSLNIPNKKIDDYLLYENKKYSLLCDSLTIYAKRHDLDFKNNVLFIEASKYVYKGLTIDMDAQLGDYKKTLKSIIESQNGDLVSVVKEAYKKNAVFTLYILNKYANKSADIDYNLDKETSFYKRCGKKLRYIIKDRDLHEKIRRELAKL